MMRNLWDGFLSLCAAVLTAAVTGFPAWGAFLAIRAELVPMWAYVPLAGLVVVGVIMILAFLRKASKGVSPGRERPRRS